MYQFLSSGLSSTSKPLYFTLYKMFIIIIIIIIMVQTNIIELNNNNNNNNIHKEPQHIKRFTKYSYMTKGIESWNKDSGCLDTYRAKSVIPYYWSTAEMTSRNSEEYIYEVWCWPET